MTPVNRTEPFKENTIEKIRTLLEKLDEMGQAKFFSVQVDGETVISRTNNPNELDNLKRLLAHNTEFVRFCYYRSSEGEPYEVVTYELPRNGNQGSLSGIEVSEMIKNAIDAERRKWEFDQLKSELSRTKQELFEAEKYIDQMEAMVDELKQSKGRIGNVHVGEVISVMVESFMRRNVDKLKKFPGGSALAGLLSESTPQEQSPSSGEATFEQMNDAENSWWDDVQLSFTNEEIECIKSIIAHLVQHKEKIKTVLELLFQK